MREKIQHSSGSLVDELIRNADVQSLIDQRKLTQTAHAEFMGSVSHLLPAPIDIPKTDIVSQYVVDGDYSQTSFHVQTTTSPLAPELVFSESSIDALKKEISDTKKYIKEAQTALVQGLLAKEQHRKQDVVFEPSVIEVGDTNEPDIERTRAETQHTENVKGNQSAGVELLSKTVNGLRSVVARVCDYSTKNHRAKVATKRIGDSPLQCYDNITKIIGELERGAMTRSGLASLESNIKQLNQMVNVTGIMCNRANTVDRKLKGSEALNEQSKYLEKSLDMLRSHSEALNKASSILKQPFDTQKLVKSIEATLESVTHFMQSIKAALSPQTAKMSM
ncbi:hypothetical protein KW459_15845 [Vibrio fluvialis]|nr:hypothetical protein [Vibrio fluvialis]